MGETLPGKTLSPFNGEAINETLKGLNSKISIIKSGDVLKADRFDGEYFKPEYLEIEKKLKKNKWDFLGNQKKYIRSFGAYSLCNKFEYKKSGIPFLRCKDIKDGLIDFSNVLYIDQEASKLLWKSEVKAKTVLFSMSGSVGNCAIANEELIFPINSNQDIAKIVTKNSLNPYFLTIFLQSKYGNSQIQRLPIGSIQKHIFLWQIDTFKIPLFPETFQLQIEKLVKEAYQKQTQAKQLYKQAEQILLEELQLINYNPKHTLYFETTANKTNKAVRFDADYFQPKYQDIIKRIENYKGGWDFVGNILNFNKKKFFPKKNEFYNYIPLSKVSNNGEIEIPEKELGKYLPTRARIKVKKGEIILSSIEGSLKTSALIQKEHNGFIVSNGFYVFNSEKINSETLFVLFKLKIMIELLKKISKGAILGGYDLTSFEKIKIPLIPLRIQEEIAEKINKSHRLRKESKKLLQEAKNRVEAEIEKEVANN